MSALAGHVPSFFGPKTDYSGLSAPEPKEISAPLERHILPRKLDAL